MNIELSRVLARSALPPTLGPAGSPCAVFSPKAVGWPVNSVPFAPLVLQRWYSLVEADVSLAEIPQLPSNPLPFLVYYACERH